MVSLHLLLEAKSSTLLSMAWLQPRHLNPVSGLLYVTSLEKTTFTSRVKGSTSVEFPASAQLQLHPGSCGAG